MDSNQTPFAVSNLNLRRSHSDRMVAGVCGGIAPTLGVPASALRILLLVATVFGFGLGVVLYVAAWVLVPTAEPAAVAASGAE